MTSRKVGGTCCPAGITDAASLPTYTPLKELFLAQDAITNAAQDTRRIERTDGLLTSTDSALDVI
jgi:hypothetical protein